MYLFREKHYNEVPSRHTMLKRWWSWNNIESTLFQHWVSAGFQCIINFLKFYKPKIQIKRHMQSIRTQIRLLLKKQSDQGLQCFQFHHVCYESLHKKQNLAWNKMFKIFGHLQYCFTWSPLLRFFVPGPRPLTAADIGAMGGRVISLFPNVKLKQLPFYDVIDELQKPTLLCE